MSKKTKSTKVVVPGRFSFVNLWEPKSVNGSDPKYSLSLIIPKNDKNTVNAILRATEEAKERRSCQVWW
jgi:hypothetical protein